MARGVEFTRELVTEPANVIYPESFVARCQERMAGTGLTLAVGDIVGTLERTRAIVTFFTGSEGCTTSKLGVKAVCVTGVKSLTGS